MSLAEIVEKHPSDKCVKWGHDYIVGYSELFDLKKNNVKNVLEIGIGCLDHEKAMQGGCEYRNGNSLRMWRDYFVNANIYAIDIFPEAMLTEEERVQTFLVDQSSETGLSILKNEISSKLDIIIDDGSHLANHQVFSFIHLEDSLTNDGIYVIEDVQPNYIESFKDLSIFPEDYQSYIESKYEISWFDTRSKTGIVDDFLMVFKRK